MQPIDAWIRDVHAAKAALLQRLQQLASSTNPVIQAKFLLAQDAFKTKQTVFDLRMHDLATKARQTGQVAQADMDRIMDVLGQMEAILDEALRP